MIPQLSNNGYHYIDLTKDKETKRITIHRLVAFTFVHNPNPEKFKIVNHICTFICMWHFITYCTVISTSICLTAWTGQIVK